MLPSLTKGCGQTERHQMPDLSGIKNHELLDVWAEESENKNIFRPHSSYTAPQYHQFCLHCIYLHYCHTEIFSSMTAVGGGVFATYSVCKMNVYILYHQP